MSNVSAAFGHALRDRWLLDESVLYFNHGSVGATPRAVLAAQDEWRRRIERAPVRFMSRELEPELRRSASVLADFLGADGDGLVFVDNATSAINAVLAGIEWRAGEEIVLCREAYSGVRNAVAWHAQRRGVVVRWARFPVPLSHPGEVIDALQAVLGPRTRLALLDHVTSTLGVVLPLAEMIARCRAHGVPVLVDGAHAPGMVDVSLATLGADWYAGNGHKWLCAPRGTGFLWTTPERRAGTRPLVTSVWHGEGYPREFDWAGTRDVSGWLAVPAALAFLRELGVERMRSWQQALVTAAADRLGALLGAIPAAPREMLAALVSLRLPTTSKPSVGLATVLHDRLLDEHAIEVPVYAVDDALWMRISAQVYLDADDLNRLAKAVAQVLISA